MGQQRLKEGSSDGSAGRETGDAELIGRYLEGDLQAFDELYAKYKRRLYAYVNRVLPGQSAVADDVFQMTWVKALKQLRAYKHNERFLAWMTRIAHNLAVDHFRKAGREVSDEEVSESAFSSGSGGEPWRTLDNKELAGALEECVEKLKSEQREVFVLRQEGLSFKEIAAVQNCSINTALGRMQYALRNLRACMSGWRGFD